MSEVKNKKQALNDYGRERTTAKRHLLRIRN